MLATMMVVRIVMMIMITFAVVLVRMVMMMMMRPGREWVGETAPALGALAHLRVVQETGVERGLQALSIDR